MSEHPADLFEGEPEHPGEKLREILAGKGLTQDELAVITGRSRPLINEIIGGKRGITAEMAIALAAAKLGDSPEFWLNLENAYRLSRAVSDAPEVRRRARIYEVAPIKEMQKRGWIAEVKDVDSLESELKGFFGVTSLEEDPQISAAPRKSDATVPLTPIQRAWCFRAKQMAAVVHAENFKRELLPQCSKRLRELAAFPDESRNVATVLAGYGIRFVVVEPLVNSKIDGATLWLTPNKPVVAMSVRRDQIDRFWFTLFHELSHVLHGDASVDTALIGEDSAPADGTVDIERRANYEAAEVLIPATSMNSFVLRVGPLYSKTRINQFAHRMKIHPGIVLGQLQHRGEVGWNANPEMLPKVRSLVTSTALTDGWGRMFSPGVI